MTSFDIQKFYMVLPVC